MENSTKLSPPNFPPASAGDIGEAVTIIGAGLAGSECAWQLAQAGIAVTLIEMRPQQKTDAHHTDHCAELVCSNSFRSDDAERNAVGLLHWEMRQCGSLIMQCADAHQVPAGGALAVDRDAFASAVTAALSAHPLITLRREEVTALPDASAGHCVIATGPLTSAGLSEAIRAHTGAEYLAFFDAIAPIVMKDSVDMSKAWFQSRYDKPGPGGTGKDYLNCPMNESEYKAFIEALNAGEKTEFKEWEKNTPYFEGCLPIEVMAARGSETLRFGPMKPVGLTNPHTAAACPSLSHPACDPSLLPHPVYGENSSLTHPAHSPSLLPHPACGGGKGGALPTSVEASASPEKSPPFNPRPQAGWELEGSSPQAMKEVARDSAPAGEKLEPTPGKPYAVVQLRQDNKLGTLYNMVGFQTKLKYAEQQRIFRMIPGLENAEFARLGGIHRNTFIHSPTLLDAQMRLKSAPHIRFAGQITGVEGYVESAATGLLVGRLLAAQLQRQSATPPPTTTALGALIHHITGGAERETFQPMNVNFGLFPPLTQRCHKKDRPTHYTARAKADLLQWLRGDEASAPIAAAV